MVPIYQLGADSPTINSVFVAPSASVIGKVTAAANSSIWFGAVLRGDADQITIGEGSNVQDNAVVHCDPGFPAIIGDHCTVGHSAIVHGCTLARGVLVGMGAIVMNGAEIGEGSIIGAGAIVTEGTKVPPFSVVLGQPGRVKKTLEPSSMADRLDQAERYIERATLFASDLTSE
ncbi:gamma carbonic anhydrase 2, mitochondrial [Maritalea myrionectae]|uniref:Gamma carbonic anhydrase 2, mitochondrial n=1 Tax=Maritalea myrionectae TaxID=454601 RepID=A0A2R4MDS5_9HYPH|nr:gamma carbonic anhydrase family protein [Maritalea myrionectae]AVX04162.1 gamma carbonic anhydrase 2, mitochondrial [Maritalea myrionectae]